MNAFRYLKIAAITVPVLLIGCRGTTMETPPIHPNMNMDDQNRVEAQEENRFFTDNRAMRQPVEGTISRGNLRQDKAMYQGINDDSSFVSENPLELNKKLLLRGQDRYDIYCTPCHGIAGDGQGVIMTGGYGYVPAPTFHQDRLRNVNDGYMYSVIANGIRNMPSYAHQIPVKDRWAIVAYVRALQRSQNVSEEEMKQYDVDLASLKQEYKKKQEAEEAEQQAQAAESNSSEVSAQMGRTIAQNNACMTCHSTDGSKLTGPTWKNAFGHEVQLQDGSTVTVDEEYLRESIVNSQAKVVAGFQPIMPNYDFLSDTEIQSLIAYIKSLSEAAPAEDSETESQESSGGTNNETSDSQPDTTTENTTNTQQTAQSDTAASASAATSDTTDTTKIKTSTNTTETLSASARAGKELFQTYDCLSCHYKDDTVKDLAPSFEGLYGSSRKLEDGSTVIADDGYIKESIQYPRAKVALGYNGYMPSYRDLMTDQELQSITDYIKTLK